MSAYPHLFSPLRIGSVTVRNRIMQTAHVKLFAHDAVDSQRNVDYQAARARGEMSEEEYAELEAELIELAIAERG